MQMSNPERQYYNYPGYPQPQRGQHEQGWQPLPPPYQHPGPLQMNSMFPHAAQPPQSPTTSLPVSAWRESPNQNEADDGTINSRYRHLGDGPSLSYNATSYPLLHQQSSYHRTSSALSHSLPDFRRQPGPTSIPFESQIKPVYGQCPPHLQPTSNEILQTMRRPSTKAKRRQYPSRAEYISTQFNALTLCREPKVPRTGRGGRIQCRFCRQAKRGRACKSDESDPRSRCTYCVERDFDCSARTFGPEKEQRSHKNRQEVIDLSAACERGGELPVRKGRASTKTEAARSAAGTFLTMAEIFPSIKPDALASFTNDVVDPTLFSEDDCPLERLF